MMISAIILAAGEGSRMGTLKQLLPWGESTVLETVINKIISSSLDGEIRVVLGCQAGRIKNSISEELADQIKFLLNEEYQQGMFSSVLTGIADLSPQTEGLLFMLADQPLVPVEVYNQIINKFCREKPLLLVPSYNERRGHPLIISTALIPEIYNLPCDGQHPPGGLRSLLAKYSQEIEYLELDDDSVLIDLDYQEDYRKYAPEGKADA